MLESLHVKNLALIKDAELDLKGGLNVLSGETGAGKSLLLGSVNLALGARADASLVRHNEKSAYVELVFSAEEPHILAALSALNIEPDEGRVIISRKIGAGKNQGRINGESVTAVKLREVSELLLNIHGQREHQSLLKEENRLEVLDGFLRREICAAREEYAEAYRSYREKREQVLKLGGDDEDRKRKLDFLEFELREISEAALKPGEDEKLYEEQRRLSSAARLADTLAGAVFALREKAEEAVSDSVRALTPLADTEPAVRSLYDELNELSGLLSDAVKDAELLLNASDTDGERLAAVEERLTLIEKLKKKYGNSADEILKTGEKLSKEYSALREFDDNKEKVLSELSEEKGRLIRAAERLHEIRSGGAGRFSEKMEEALRDLNFNSVVFVTSVEATTHYSPEGADRVSFLISTNPGEAPGELEKVASGGELSRIMLAVKNLMADTDRVPTLIFDEIDTGISGRTAAAVAVKMQQIAGSHQVICISHLPQIVAAADHNFLIEKSVANGETVTELSELSPEEALRELARLVGAGETTGTGLLHAAEMKERMRRKDE